MNWDKVVKELSRIAASTYKDILAAKDTDPPEWAKGQRIRYHVAAIMRDALNAGLTDTKDGE